MKHNTVLMAWPVAWKQTQDSSARKNFIGKLDGSTSNRGFDKISFMFVTLAALSLVRVIYFAYKTE